MGTLKDTAFALAEAGMTMMELADKGESFVITFQPEVGYTWFRPNTGAEYRQDDWIFHALGQGSATTLDAAVEAMAADFAKHNDRAVTPIRPRKQPAKKVAPRKVPTRKTASR